MEPMVSLDQIHDSSTEYILGLDIPQIYMLCAKVQAANLEAQLKQTQKMFESSKLNLTQAVEACNFATKKRRAAERQLAKLQVCSAA